MRKIRRMVSVVMISWRAVLQAAEAGKKQEARMENDRERKAGQVRSGRASQKDTDRKP